MVSAAAGAYDRAGGTHVFALRDSCDRRLVAADRRTDRQTDQPGIGRALRQVPAPAMPGFNWIIPAIDRMFLVNVTEVMVNAERHPALQNGENGSIEDLSGETDESDSS